MSVLFRKPYNRGAPLVQPLLVLYLTALYSISEVIQGRHGLELLTVVGVLLGILGMIPAWPQQLYGRTKLPRLITLMFGCAVLFSLFREGPSGLWLLSCLPFFATFASLFMDSSYIEQNGKIVVSGFIDDDWDPFGISENVVLRLYRTSSYRQSDSRLCRRGLFFSTILHDASGISWYAWRHPRMAGNYAFAERVYGIDAEAARRYAVRYFYNDITPASIIVMPTSIEEEAEKKRLAEAIRQREEEAKQAQDQIYPLSMAALDKLEAPIDQSLSPNLWAKFSSKVPVLRKHGV
jgi:hypothetical protein